MSKRKIVSFLMAFMMIFTLIPASVFADESETQGGVVINVAPSTANVTFYEGETAESVLDASKVTDNGIVNNYHQYVLNVDEGVYSYRGVDTLGTEDTSDDRNLGGMSFKLPLNEEIMEDGSASGEGQTMTLRCVNFYTTNANITEVGDYNLELYPSNLPQATNGDQYLGTIGSNETIRVITPVLAMARGNALTYQGKITLKESLKAEYGVSNIVNYTISAGTSVVNKTFALTALKLYSITAPAEAKAQVFNQINNFNVEEIPQTSQVENEDGTITHNYNLISGNKTYRVSMKGKITRAGYFGNKAEAVVVTYEEDENPGITGHELENATIQRRMEASTMVNVNGQNNLKITTGETFRLRAYRGAWQIINSDTANIMIEPDFNYNVISGGNHIKMTPATNKCTGNAGTGEETNWMDITGVSAGTAIIEVSYDAIKIGGEGTSYDGLYGATDPQRTSLVVINVGSEEASLQMKAVDAQSIWDSEYDTAYFTGENGTIEFTATMDEEVPDKVELSTDKGNTWKEVVAVEGVYKAEGLVGGNNIIRFTKGNKVEYQVVRAAKVTYTVKNISREGEEIIAGDEVKIVFKGLYTPISKFSGIYNPGFGQGHKVAYTLPETVTAVAAGGQYDFISTNSYTVTTTTEGKVNLTGGHVEFNVMGVDDPLGGHRTLTDAGVGSNFSAVSTMHARGILPDISLDVVAMPMIPVTVDVDTEGADIVVTDTDGTEYTAEEGVYKLPYGTFQYVVTKEGYVREAGRFAVAKADYLNGSKTISLKMRKIEGPIWDGTTVTEPEQVDGVYHIGTGAELAWFAANAGGTSYNAILTDDISLGGFEWTPIANSSNWKGNFDGNGHYITDLYINSTANNVALFGYVGSGAVIKNLGVKGEVTTTGKYAAGIATSKAATIKFEILNCKSDVNVIATQYAAGVVANQSANVTVKDCYNTGAIKVTMEKSSGLTAGGVSCPSSQSQKVVIENSYNTGNISGVGKHGSVVYLSSSSYAANVKNCYGLEGTSGTNSVADIDVTADELKALASTLGEAYLENNTSYNNGYPILAWEEPYALPYAKEAGIADVANYKDTAAYREAEVKVIEDTIETAKTQIEAATSMAEVKAAVETAKGTLDALKTDDEYAAEELEVAKAAAKEALANYKNLDDYRDAQKEEIVAMIASANTSIDAAERVKDVETIIVSVKSEIDKVKTDVQLTKEESASALEKAEAAQAAAEAAQKAAEAAQAAAEEAQRAAEEAQNATEVEKAEVERLKAEAEEAQVAAEEAQKAAEEALAAAEAEKIEIEKLKSEAEAAQKAAEEAQRAAEEAIAAAILVTEMTGASKSTTSVKLSWEKITGVKGYYISRATSANGEYVVVKNIKSNKTTSWTNTKLECGKTYYYKISAYRVIDGKTYIGEASDVFKIKAKPAKAKIKKVIAKNNAAQVKWAKQKDVTGYKIYRATSKNGSYKLVKTIKSAKTVKWTNKKLKDSKKYYYKVRAYKTVKGKAVYGPYSAVKSVKTK